MKKNLTRTKAIALVSKLSRMGQLPIIDGTDYNRVCTQAVADALRFAMMTNGIPAIYYSDNGGGQINKTMDADIVGILPRLGVHHETGIPGNPQGRGIIERVMKTLAHPIARAFPTYFGPNADSDTVRQTLTAVDSLAKRQTDVAKIGKDLTPKQKSAIGKLPTWGELFVVIEQAVHWYNTEHKHEVIRRIHDKSGVGVVLAGMPRLRANLRGKRGEYKQLYSRIGFVCDLADRLPDDDIGELVLGVLGDNECNDSFVKASNGNARRLSKIIRGVNRIAKMNNKPVSAKMVQRISEMLID